MFNGVPIEQFHQFISTPSSRTTSFSTSNFLSFDPLLFPPLPTHNLTLFQSHDLLQTPSKSYDEDQGKVHQEINLDMRSDGIDPWSNDEIIQLLSIKSSSDNWFQETSWEHVSRKLAEIGYKRTAEKCKEKFEEETCRNFNSTILYNKNSTRYILTEELDEDLYRTDQKIPHHITVDSPEKVKHHCNIDQEEEINKKDGGGENQENEIQGQKCEFERDPKEVMVQQTQHNVQVVNEVEMTKSKKRKRKHKKLEMFKGLCVDLVKQMIAQQEEMHKKLLDDMANRDEEKIAREEAWRKEEMERVKREIVIRQHEQVIARDRQSTINEFLEKFNYNEKMQLFSNTTTSTTSEIPKITFLDGSNTKDDIGKRWPRDEVLALINMRCNVYDGTSGNNEEHEGYIGNYNSYKGGSGGGVCGGSLWERISQGMLELGYNRSAKRCKEKWENINKYFRKTKDGNKKRSLDSRTCPYYHQLSTLYNRGKLAPSSKSAEQSCDFPEKGLMTEILPEN